MSDGTCDHNKPAFLKKIFAGNLELSKALTEEAPRVLRVVLLPLCFFVLLLFGAVLSPVLFIISRFAKKRKSAFEALRMELETKWYAESSHEALKELRDWRKRLKGNPALMRLRGARFDPYGSFGLGDYHSILNLLFHWEFRHGNYKESREVCDEILDACKKIRRLGYNKTLQYWVVQKAKAINAMDGHLAAQKFLFEYVDPAQRNSQVNVYFEELRKQQKTTSN